jgi:hypothetical protein
MLVGEYRIIDDLQDDHLEIPFKSAWEQDDKRP